MSISTSEQKPFQSSENRLYAKKVNNKEQPPGPQDHHDPNRNSLFINKSVEVKGGEPAVDYTSQHAGAISGIATSAAAQNPSADKIQHTPGGSSISVLGGIGQEQIDIRHASGAGIVIGPDGAVYFTSTGKKGFGISAVRGDGFVSAQRVVIDAEELILQSKGNIQFHSGGNMQFYTKGNKVSITSGSEINEVDGRLTTEVGLTNSLTVGGDHRQTVAGDIRIQTPNNIRTDSKGTNIRTTENIELEATKSLSLLAKSDSTFSASDGAVTVSSKGLATLGSTDGMVNVIGKTAATLESENTVNLRGTNYVNIDTIETAIDSSSKISLKTDEMKLYATSSIDQRTETMNLNATDKLETRSGGTTKMSAGDMDIDSSGPIDMRGSTIDFNKAGAAAASPTEPSDPQVSTPRTTAPIEQPQAAEFPDAKAIIGSMITSVDIPDFPHNAKKMSASEVSVLQNEGNQINQKATQVAGQNKTSGSTVEIGSSVGELPTFEDNNTSVATESKFPLPGGTESFEKLSKNVSTSSFIGFNQIPGNGQSGASREDIIKSISHLCSNILDPVIDKFGSEVSITSGFRKKDGSSSQHHIGKAVDIRATNRNDFHKTAAIAQWIVDNLPFKKVLLERNDSPGIHVHVEAAEPGSGAAKGQVFTCGDPKCNSKTPGLNLNYAIRALEKFKGS